MAGHFVFPGGTVDPADRDFDFWKTHIDLDLKDISTRLGGEHTDADALAYAVTAVRETLEEAGVLLACREKLHELLKYANLHELTTVASRRTWGEPLLPRLVPLVEGAVIVEPWDPMYTETEIKIDPTELPAAVLPVGAPFSKLWHDAGIWKPVCI
jgi:8-oxo-dGTP pyrophosphatase MutT (NUDIX family)